MAKTTPKKRRKPNTRSKEQTGAYHNTLNAGINYLRIQSLGDTSKLGEQAKVNSIVWDNYSNSALISYTTFRVYDTNLQISYLNE